MEFYIDALKRYADFNGRATRQQFWMFVLINFIIGIVLQVIDAFAGLQIKTGDGPGQAIGILNTIYSLAVLLPTLGIGARRLHDIGKSGWWQLLNLVCCVGWIILIVWYATDSAPGSNEYGPNPKGQARRRDDDD